MLKTLWPWCMSCMHFHWHKFSTCNPAFVIFSHSTCIIHMKPKMLQLLQDYYLQHLSLKFAAKKSFQTKMINQSIFRFLGQITLIISQLLEGSYLKIKNRYEGLACFKMLLFLTHKISGIKLVYAFTSHPSQEKNWTSFLLRITIRRFMRPVLQWLLFLWRWDR